MENPAIDVMLSDRNIGADASGAMQSIQEKSKPGQWVGGIAFMDGHVEQLETHVVNETDNLFEDSDEDGDAMMIYEGQ